MPSGLHSRIRWHWYRKLRCCIKNCQHPTTSMRASLSPPIVVVGAPAAATCATVVGACAGLVACTVAESRTASRVPLVDTGGSHNLSPPASFTSVLSLRVSKLSCCVVEQNPLNEYRHHGRKRGEAAGLVRRLTRLKNLSRKND